MTDADSMARGYEVIGQVLFWIFILFLLACPICSAIVANSKGRDPVGWFFAGLFFGPFGLIAIAGMPTANMSEDIKALRGKSRLKQLCPACYEPVWSESDVCGHCGTDFDMWHGREESASS